MRAVVMTSSTHQLRKNVDMIERFSAMKVNGLPPACGPCTICTHTMRELRTQCFATSCSSYIVVDFVRDFRGTMLPRRAGGDLTS